LEFELYLIRSHPTINTHSKMESLEKKIKSNLNLLLWRIRCGCLYKLYGSSD